MTNTILYYMRSDYVKFFAVIKQTNYYIIRCKHDSFTIMYA
jgi:hypothetical protein